LHIASSSGHTAACLARAISRAEGDLVVAVAAAGMGLGVVAGKQVGVGAAGPAAVEGHAGAAREEHGQVVAVDHRDVVEVLAAAAADGELGQRHGRLPRERAGECAAAVACLAAPPAAVEGAPRAPPHPAGLGPRRHVHGSRLPGVKLRAAAHRGGRRPHRRAAVVGDGECGRPRLVATKAATRSKRAEEAAAPDAMDAIPS
jgi:hypothetical protein